MRKFAATELPASCRVKPTNLYSLYHDRCGLSRYRDRLLRDFETRKLPFPTQEDLNIPLISTIDGSLIGHESGNRSAELLRKVLDMTLLNPTDWVAVQDTLVSFAEVGTSGDDDVVHIHNYGPGYGALKARKDLPTKVKVTDASLSEHGGESNENHIAIVGMGVDLPGAPDSEELWRILMDGINTCSEVSLLNPMWQYVSDYTSRSLRNASMWKTTTSETAINQSTTSDRWGPSSETSLKIHSSSTISYSVYHHERHLRSTHNSASCCRRSIAR